MLLCSQTTEDGQHEGADPASTREANECDTEDKAEDDDEDEEELAEEMQDFGYSTAIFMQDDDGYGAECDDGILGLDVDTTLADEEGPDADGLDSGSESDEDDSYDAVGYAEF